MVRLITDFEVTSPIQNIGLVWPFPSGTGIANLHYPTLRVGISTSIKAANNDFFFNFPLAFPFAG